MKLIFTIFYLFMIISPLSASEVPYDSMVGCKREFTNWARVQKVQLDDFSDAFPDTIWEGTLQDRVTKLQELWPENIKVVDDVIFQAKNGAGEITGSGSKKVVVVSLKGLKAKDLQQLKQDYTDAVSWLTVSFPLKEEGKHLYTRIGNQSVDYFGWITKSEYDFGKSERLEPVLELSPEEQFRLNTYAKNAVEDTHKLLGPEDYQGATDAKGTLTNNKPKKGCGGHNCTSWVGLAPVGNKKEALVEIIGAQKYWNVHTSPGWFLQQMTAQADKNRVPFVFFFSKKDINELTATRIKNNEVFDWKFSLPE